MMGPLRVDTASIAGALALGGASAAPAQAAGPVVTGGLVNVTLTNVLNNNQVVVAVPIQAAAAICAVSVDVLSLQLTPGSTFTNCVARNGNQTVTVSR